MSEQSSEDGEMSSLAEMHSLVHEAADYAAASDNWKDRVQAAAKAFGLGWERAKAFYYQDARRVDAKEMDDARKAIKRLRAAEHRRKTAEHIEWLRATLEHHRQNGSDMDRAELAVAERVLTRIGASDSSMGSTGPAEFDADADQSQDWGR